jgi:hypothetical protein
MTPSLGTIDPAYLIVLLVGLVGVVAFSLETLVFDYHPDALLFVGAFSPLLAGIVSAALDPNLFSFVSNHLYHGVGVMGTGLAMFVLAYGRRRVLLRSGKEVSRASVVGELDGGEE